MKIFTLTEWLCETSEFVSVDSNGVYFRIHVDIGSMDVLSMIGKTYKEEGESYWDVVGRYCVESLVELKLEE